METNIITIDKDRDLKKIYGYNYANVITKFFNEYEVMNIDNLQSYFNTLKSTKSIATCQLHKAALKKYIITTSKLDYNQRAVLNLAFSDIKLGKSNKRIDDSKVASKDVVKKMIQLSSERDALIIKTLYSSGMRISELISIELKNCEVIDNLAYISIIGKGSKQRTIQLAASLYTEIVNTFGSTKYLFQTKNGNKYNRSNLYRVVTKASQRATGTDRIHPHTLRHSFATEMLTNNKQTLKSVSNYLGHSSTSITADIYIHDNIEADVLTSILD